MTVPGIPAPAILIATGRSGMYSSRSATGYGAPSRKSNLRKCGTTDVASPIRSSSGQCDAMSSDTLGSGVVAVCRKRFRQSARLGKGSRRAGFARRKYTSARTPAAIKAATLIVELHSRSVRRTGVRPSNETRGDRPPPRPSRLDLIERLFYYRKCA